MQAYYPPPLFQDDAEQPGFWANAAANGDIWTKSIQLRRKPDFVLSALLQLPLLREPATRLETSSNSFLLLVKSRTWHALGLLAQAVGTKMDVEQQCQCCQRGHGQFVSCVMVLSLQHLMPGCVNCYWGNRRNKCKPGKTHPVPTPNFPHAAIDAVPTIASPAESIPMESPFTPIGSPLIPMESPFSTIESPFSVMESPFSSMESPFNSMESPFGAMDSSFSAMEIPFSSTENPCIPVEGHSRSYEELEHALEMELLAKMESQLKYVFAKRRVKDALAALNVHDERIQDLLSAKRRLLD
ncbi:hypothetical protein N7520_008803 [Penicillium odoratum]|uniref:uncharacterized protein n=1 Tax=Penicillium odoratum TaxID=1167516 RepID=UPI00254785FD|nr:uncharacterized protein N7520_008803 [Penicillium odoratum]KAJ5751886.1 hypothetical protein N7520_008803 [Penicillium odoratum]